MGKRMTKFILWSGMFFLLLFPTYDICASEQPMSYNTAPVVRVKDNLLTVKAKNYPFNKLMTEISNKTSITITLHVESKDLVYADFHDTPVEKGLRHLTRNYNTIFIYVSGNGENPEINEVIIFDKTGARPGKIIRPKPMAPRKRGTALSGNVRASDLKSQTRVQKNKAPSSQEKSLEALLESKDAGSIIDLGKVLAEDKNPDVKAEAVKTLGELGNDMAVIPLTYALHDKDAGVRENAVDALCRIGGDKVIQALKNCLSDKDKNVRKAAAEALKGFEEKQ